MRPRRSVPLALTCAAVALTGCGGSKLLDGGSASDLQASLSKVRTAIDDGECSQARTAARAGTQKVDQLPGSVDAELKDSLKKGFAELTASVATDCEATSTTTQPTTTTTPQTDTTTTTTDTAPTEPDTTPDDTTPLDPPDTETVPLDPPTTDPGDPTLPDDGGGDDGSGGVTPGVDGPGSGITQRSAPGAKGQGTGLDTFEKRLKNARRRAEQYFRGRGGG